MQAAAIYFRDLRDAQGISRARLAAQLNVSEMSLWRIEEQGQEPKAELLMALVQSLGASLEHVYTLMTEDITTETARAMAADWVNRQKPDQRQAEFDRLVALARELEADPRKYGQLLGYAERLREENN